MKKLFLAPLTVFLFLMLSRSQVFSVEPTNASAPIAASEIATNSPDEPSPADIAAMKGLNDLVSRINDKLTLDKTNDTDLVSNLNEFETLVDKHKDASPLVQAQILAKKAELYMEILGEPEKALPVLKQIKAEYPTVQVDGSTDDVINMIERMLERKKITESLVPGALFPDFSENDVEGKPLSISQYKGKVVLVDFWATWCVPCIMELPEIQKSYSKYHSQGLEVVGVSLDEEKDRLQQFVKQKKLPWPQFFDGKRWENKLAMKYGVDQTPTVYLINRDGRIIKKFEPGEDIYAEVGKALK